MRKMKKISKNPRIAIIGWGYVGKAYAKMFPDAVIYDEPLGIIKRNGKDVIIPNFKNIKGKTKLTGDFKVESARDIVNECDLALICVPTDLKDGKLDISIVREVVDWLETPLILIKSALQPGTVDILVERTGKKIAVSCELVGMGSYHIPAQYPDPRDPTKHQTLIIGGEPKVAEACAEILWAKMAPTISIHLVSALEAEITKLVENFYGALKVTWVNTLMSLTQKADVSFIKVHQAWQSDPRVEGMHQRAVSFKRGWQSHCWAKDPQALLGYAEEIGAKDMATLINTVIRLNEEHLSSNESSNSSK